MSNDLGHPFTLSTISRTIPFLLFVCLNDVLGSRLPHNSLYSVLEISCYPGPCYWKLKSRKTSHYSTQLHQSNSSVSMCWRDVEALGCDSSSDSESSNPLRKDWRRFPVSKSHEIITILSQITEKFKQMLKRREECDTYLNMSVDITVAERTW